MYKVLVIFIIMLYIIPLTFVMDDYIFEYIQLMIIFSGFFLPIFIIKRKSYSSIDYSDYLNSSGKLLTYIAIFYFSLKINSLMDIFNHLVILNDYAEWTLSQAVARYDTNEDKSLWFKISTIMFLTYSFLLGSYKIKNANKVYFFIYILMIFVESSELARAGVLIGFTAYITEYLIRKNNYFYKLSFYYYLRYGVIILLLVFIIFVFSAYFRVAGKDDVIDILIMKLSQYTIAMYKALLIWMNTTETYGDTYGYATFTSIYKIFGIKAQQGFYLLVDTEYGSTNIYTTIRGLLSDFGFAMSFLFFMSVSLFLKYFSFQYMNVFHYFFIRLIIFMIIFMIYSPFLFFTVLIAFIFSYFLLLVDNNKIKVRNKNVL